MTMIPFFALFSLLTVSVAQVLIGDLITKQHKVSGKLYAVNTRTLRIEDFVYDGTGPAAAFWVDTGLAATSSGAVPRFTKSCEANRELPKYTGQTVELELPNNLTIADIGYFSVWCIQAKAEFGGIAIDGSSLDGVPVLEEAICPKRAQSETAAVFPVPRGWNCEPLSAIYQVRWQVDLPNSKVNFQLVGRLPEDNFTSWYMGFGLSGSNEKTEMIGSDVAIGYIYEEKYIATDFHLSAQQPCAGPMGVCPDKNSNSTAVDDVGEVGGGFKDDITMISYSRPIMGTDPELDKDIIIDGPQFVAWAIGPIQPTSMFPFKHRGEFSAPLEPVSIEFGREAEDKCSGGVIIKVPEEAVVDVPGFERPVLYNTTNINARIGPSGGSRGVSAITNRPSWGIAWYLSGTGSESKDILIPVLGVERGKTYTFNVYGGIPKDENDTSVHPFYITSNPLGGYGIQSPKKRANETVYAGIDQIERNKEGGVVSFRSTGTGALCELDSTGNDTSTTKDYDEFYGSLDRSCVANPAIRAKGGKVVWKVEKDTPNFVYYHCVTHETLGYKIRVFDAGKTDVAELRDMSGGAPLSQERDDSCMATFKGEEREFKGCSKGIGPNRAVDVFWTIDERKQEIETLFRAPSDVGYVSLGWGFKEMVGSSAVVAFKRSGKTEIGEYLLKARDSSGVQPNSGQGLISSESEVSDEFLTGVFKRPLNANGLPAIESGPMDLIWAVGPTPESPTKLSQHTVSGTGNVDLSSVGISTPVSEKSNAGVNTIFIVHGVFMGISWLVIVPVAITAMRYFKKYNPVTYNVHRILNGCAGALTLAGFIMAVTAGSRTETAHLVIGIIVTAFVLVQVALGVFRPRKETPKRKAWFWVHAITGSVLSGLGIANCFLGIGTDVIGGPVGWYIAAGVVTGVFVLIQITLGFIPKKFPMNEDQKPLVDRGQDQGRNFVRND